MIYICTKYPLPGLFYILCLQQFSCIFEFTVHYNWWMFTTFMLNLGLSLFLKTLQIQLPTWSGPTLFSSLLVNTCNLGSLTTDKKGEIQCIVYKIIQSKFFPKKCITNLCMHKPLPTVYGYGRNVHLWHFPWPKRPWPKCPGRNVLGRNIRGRNVLHSTKSRAWSKYLVHGCKLDNWSMPVEWKELGPSADILSNIRLDPYQGRQNIEPDLHPNILTLWCINGAMLLSKILDTDQVWPRHIWYHFQTHWAHCYVGPDLRPNRLVHDGSKTDERPARLWAIWSNEKYLVFFSNILDPDHVQQNVGIDLEPNCLTLWCSHSKLYKKPSPDIIFKHFAPRSGSINLKTSGLRTCLLMTNKRVIQRNGSDPGVTANKNNIISI